MGMCLNLYAQVYICVHLTTSTVLVCSVLFLFCFFCCFFLCQCLCLSEIQLVLSLCGVIENRSFKFIAWCHWESYDVGLRG